jgi:hypothetical protein
MPYVNARDRKSLEFTKTSLGVTWQELSFQLCANIRDFFVGKKLNSQTIGEAWAAIEGAKQAFDQEVAIPYEAKKRFENGEIFHDIRTDF